ncbi:vacuolar sorting protein [Artomyces pyxidatus]|uniref:Vacuolar sorting protein n=1 Tax=Artomyces pyxidatus TaxID=48021 RepID=A0ACB8TK24_9AGAM|nr:vacuolar sorting protein [Artomyces pyxidatus]
MSSSGPDDYSTTLKDGVSFRGRAREFLDLHDQVQTSVNLLDSLESFLSTFQKDLSAVSGQISDLQARSRDIESRLKSRKKIEKPLAGLITTLTLPPPLATLILDTDVGEPWVPAIEDFERRLESVKVRSRVRAARDLGEVAEGLRIVAATKLRAFFLALLHPIRTSMTTNMQVMQTSVFLKYRSLYTFLLRNAPSVATEVQKAYVSAARTYYETGFRRYMRSLGWVKTRSAEKENGFLSGLDVQDKQADVDLERLNYARIEGPGVTLTYMADDKSYKETVEALLRSCLLVLMDNGTAEYAFITAFFAHEPNLPAAPEPRMASSSLFSPTALNADLPADDGVSTPGTEFFVMTPRPRQRTDSLFSTDSHPPAVTLSKEEQAALNATWKQIMDPALDHAKAFVQAVLEPLPPVIPLLTMIRLTEEVMIEIQKRGCSPLETFVFGIRLQMWPLFQKAMTDQVEALKKLAEGASGGYFRRAVTTSDTSVSNICTRYVGLFLSSVMLTEQNEETMIFSNLLRLRHELTKLIESHTDKLGDLSAKAKARSTLYEELLQGLTRAFRSAPGHPKAQTEIAYWREKEEEARNRVMNPSRIRA